ncbi:MAG: hypothetical protein GOV01_01480 [Candidatus Altiarchaeota archaeon]|nr:hypothetical protein [Candidatus Altiarchaeota archaeon]
MRPTQVFILLNVLAFALFPFVKAVPNLEEFRPMEFVEGQEVQGGLQVFKSLLLLTGTLVILKLVKFKLVWLIDTSVFFSGYFFGSFFGIGFLLGIFLLALRKTEVFELFNISSGATILCFSLLIAPFITPTAAMLLVALLSLYDVIGVLYLPYIKFLWLEVKRDIRLDSIAILFDNGMVGAGDFALPILFSLSFGFVGILSIPLLALGFWLNQGLAKRFGAFPGIPFQALFAYLFFIAAA